MSKTAENVLDKCGGAQRVADWLGLQVSAVHRWKYPKGRGGTDGRVPTQHQQVILDRAKSEGIHLAPEDFFDAPVDEFRGAAVGAAR